MDKFSNLHLCAFNIATSDCNFCYFPIVKSFSYYFQLASF